MTTTETFWGLTSTGWEAVTASATVAAVIIALGGAVVAVRQLSSVIAQGNDARRAAVEASRPYVIVTIEPSETTRKSNVLVIRNHGRRPALAVRVKLTPPPERATEMPGNELSKARILSEEIAMIAPGQELSTFFDFTPDRLKKKPKMPNVYEAHVVYRDSSGHVFDESMTLDYAALLGTAYTEVLTTHHVAKTLKEIGSLLGASSLLRRAGRLDVEATTEPRTEAEARNERETEESQAWQAKLIEQMLPDRLDPQ